VTGAYTLITIPDFLIMFNHCALVISLLAVLSASAVAQERQWSLDRGGEDAYLVFGVPETDDVGVSFWCTMHTGVINIFISQIESSIASRKHVPFLLEAGETVARLEGKTTANPETGATSLEAKVPDDQPIFAAMKAADRFKVKVGEEENIYPLIDVDLIGLLALCRKR
jgi:hypothetical protein